MHGNDELNNALRDAQHTLEKLTLSGEPGSFYAPERMSTPTLSQMATDLENLARAIRHTLHDRLERRSGL